MATKQEITKAVMRLSQAFTAFKPDPEDMKGFMELVYEKLSPFPVSVINAAVENIIENEIYFPRLAEMLSHCWQARDKMEAELWARWQNLKQDWYGDKVHPVEVWQKLADDYKKLGGVASAKEVMDDHKKYGKVCQPTSPEKMAEVKARLAEIAQRAEMK